MKALIIFITVCLIGLYDSIKLAAYTHSLFQKILCENLKINRSYTDTLYARTIKE